MVLLAALRVRLMPPRSGHSEKLKRAGTTSPAGGDNFAQHARGRRPPRGRSPPTGVERLTSRGDWRRRAERRTAHTRQTPPQRERESTGTHTPNPRSARS